MWLVQARTACIICGSNFEGESWVAKRGRELLEFWMSLWKKVLHALYLPLRTPLFVLADYR